MHYEVTIAINAPADVVWSVLSDVEHWPQWTKSVRSVELLDANLAVGSRVRIRQPKFPSVLWKVVALSPGSAFTWQSKAPGSDALGVHRVSDNGDGTSLATLAITQRGPIGTIVAALSRRLTKRYVASEAAGLKARSEQAAARSADGDGLSATAEPRQ